MTEHIHEGKKFSADNKIVCNGCAPVGGNTCYCNCHNSDKDVCIKCKIFHK